MTSRAIRTVGVFLALALILQAQDEIVPKGPGRNTSRPVMADSASRAAVRRGLARLVEMQNESGAWSCKVGYKLNESYHGEELEHVGVTSLACMALMAGGNMPDRGPHAKALAKGLDFVLRSSRPEDGYITSNGTRMYSHAFATMFLAHAYGTTHRKDVRRVLKRAVTLLIQSQNREGGWRYQPQPVDADLSVTVSTLQALRAARNVGIAVPVTTIDRAMRYVEECAKGWGFQYQSRETYQNNDTRITYALTAAGVVSLYSGGHYRHRSIDNGIQRLRNYGALHFGKYHYFYGHYYACQALYIRGGEAWRRYYTQLKREILRHQRDDGTWSDDVGVVYATSMACLLLQLPGEWLPIFQK